MSSRGTSQRLPLLSLATLRRKIDALNHALLDHLGNNYRATPKKTLPPSKRALQPVHQALHDCCPLTDKLTTLLQQRLELVMAVGQYKTKRKLPSFRLIRELEILQQVCDYARSHRLPPLKLYTLFREIISYSLSQELTHAGRELAVSYLGPEGSYSHIAATLFIGSSITRLPQKSIIEVINTAQANPNCYAIIPIENSTAGFILEHFDLIPKPMVILSELMLPIRHQLLSRQKNLAKIETVYAHAQSFLQCQKWLAHTLPQARLVAVASNSKAAKMAASKTGMTTAAIASKKTAALYQLSLVAANIQDYRYNTTRFIVIGRKQPEWDSGALRCKTSVTVKLPHNPGSLFALLKKMKAINITRIESRPDPNRPFRYHFYLDFECRLGSAKLTRALLLLKPFIVRNYGSYPAAILTPYEVDYGG